MNRDVEALETGAQAVRARFSEPVSDRHQPAAPTGIFTALGFASQGLGDRSRCVTAGGRLAAAHVFPCLVTQGDN